MEISRYRHSHPSGKQKPPSPRPVHGCAGVYTPIDPLEAHRFFFVFFRFFSAFSPFRLFAFLPFCLFALLPFCCPVCSIFAAPTLSGTGDVSSSTRGRAGLSERLAAATGCCCCRCRCCCGSLVVVRRGRYLCLCAWVCVRVCAWSCPPPFLVSSAVPFTRPFWLWPWRLSPLLLSPFSGPPAFLPDSSSPLRYSTLRASAEEGKKALPQY